MRKLRHIALFLCWLCLSGGLSAQISQDSLPAWLHGTDVSFPPVYPIDAVTILAGPSIQFQRLDSTQLARYQTLPLADLLSEVPAVFVKSYGQVGSSTPAFRGTGAGHTQVLWNSLPINSPMLGLSDLSLSSAGMFEGVDILFGSRSLQYGDGGLGGSIHLRNKAVGDWQVLTNGLQVGQEFASYGNYRTQFALGLRKNKWWISTRALYSQGENDFDFRDWSRIDQPTATLEHSALQQGSLLQQVGWQGKTHQVTARIWLNQLDRELPPTMLVNNLTETQADASARGQLEWNADFDGWSVESVLGYARNSLDYRNLLANISSLSSNQTTDAKIKLQQHHMHNSRLIQREIGVRFGYDVAASPGYNENIDLFRGTAFVRHRIQLFDFHNLDILVRESFNQGAWTLPMGYLSYNTRIRKNNFLNLSFARNERFPTLNDLYWNPGGNPGLEKETSYTGELGYDWHQSIAHATHLHVKANVYSSLVDNWILWTPWTGNLWRPQNVQQVLTSGGEVNLQLNRRLNQWRQQFRVGYAFNSSKSRQSNGSLAHAVGKQLIYTPEHTGFLSVQIGKGKSFLYYGHQFTGVRYTSTDHSTSLPAFSLGDVRLGSNRSLGAHRLEFYGGVRNLWNADYQAIAWRPMPGRNYYGGLRLHLNFDPS